MKRLIGMALAVAMLGGCAGLPAAVTSRLTPAASSTDAQSGRAVKIQVNAPSTLATNGSLVSGDVSNVIAAGSGNVIAAGSGNVIAAGSGNVIAAGSGNLAAPVAASFTGLRFHVLASTAGFTAVQKAGVQLEKLDGTKVGQPFLTDGNGMLALTGVPDGEPLQAVSYFKVGDQLYREAVPIATGQATAPVYADPINTMVDAAVIQWLGGNTNVGKLIDFNTLKNVWSICNNAGITLKPSDLDFTPGQEQSQLVSTLVGKWNDAINAKDANGNYVLSATDRAAISAFKALLTGI